MGIKKGSTDLSAQYAKIYIGSVEVYSATDPNLKTITIDSSKVDSELSNYPVMVKVETGDIIFPADGGSINFTDDSDVDLKFERVEYSQADEFGLFYVKIPTVSNLADTTFKMKHCSGWNKW